MELNPELFEHMLKQRKIFRAYDIRGHVDVLCPTLIQKIAICLGKIMVAKGATSIVVGFDARATSAEYANIIEKELFILGVKVIHIGCVSSPLLYFTAKKFGGYGIMVTASHNAITDNGVKWLINGLPPTPQEIQQLADDVESEMIVHHSSDDHHQTLSIEHIDPFPDYLAYIQQDIGTLYGVKVCLDGLHGSAGAIAEQILVNLGCEVTALHCDADATFPLGPPDPSDIRRLDYLKQAIIDTQSCLGIALDGDGDRLVILDENGCAISPDRLLSLFAKICLMHHPQKKIVCDVKCSSLVAKTTHQYGGELHMIRTGSSFLRNYLAHSEGEAIFGGEFAGHYVFNDGRGKTYDDGLYAALRVLAYLQIQQQSLYQILAEFPERIATDDLYIDCRDVNYEKISHLIRQNTPSDAQIIQVDGLRLDFPFGFGIIRPSNTGEYFTVRFDANNAQNFDYIKQIFVTALKPYYPTIAHAMAVAYPSKGAFHVS